MFMSFIKFVYVVYNQFAVFFHLPMGETRVLLDPK